MITDVKHFFPARESKETLDETTNYAVEEREGNPFCTFLLIIIHKSYRHRGIKCSSSEKKTTNYRRWRWGNMKENLN